MLATITARIMQAGIDARVAMAPTAGAAHALARFGGKPTIIVDATELNAAIGQLPTAALRLSADVLIGLRKLGFERIAQLENTPRAPLALRFGSEIGRRLDQAFGRLSEPLNPIVPLELVRAERAFAEPIAARETIERYIAQLAQRLCEQLEARGLGARRLDLLFRRVDNLIEAVRIGTGKPVRDPARLTRLLSDQLEKVDPGFGIEQMALIASLTEPLSYRQIASDGEACRDTDIAALVDTLSNRLGAKRLFRVVPLESDLPERSVKYVPPLAPATGATWPPTLPRPGRLLPPPEPIETMALLPDHPPVQFTWRGMRRRVTRADGPERVFGEWWQRDAETGRGARLLPGRGRGRRALLDFSRRRWRGSRNRLAALVPARGLRDEPLRRAPGHLAFLLPARRQLSCEELFAARRTARHRGARHRRSQFARRHRARA